MTGGELYLVVRSLIERATRQLKFKRRLPSAFGGGRILVSPSCGLRYLVKRIDDIDPTLLRLVDEFVGDGHVVWDVGANVGLFSFASAHRCGKHGAVVAIEPDTWLVQLLRESSLMQPDSSAPVSVIPAAAAAAVDLRTFRVSLRSRATNFLDGYGTSQTGGITEQQDVIAVTLDWLAERRPHPDVLKIDVEGAELEVLHGAVDLLAAKQPIVLCEVGSETCESVSLLLHELGYRLFDGEAMPAPRPEVALATWCCVALPAGLLSKSMRKIVSAPARQLL